MHLLTNTIQGPFLPEFKAPDPQPIIMSYCTSGRLLYQYQQFRWPKAFAIYFPSDVCLAPASSKLFEAFFSFSIQWRFQRLKIHGLFQGRPWIHGRHENPAKRWKLKILRETLRSKTGRKFDKKNDVFPAVWNNAETSTKDGKRAVAPRMYRQQPQPPVGAKHFDKVVPKPEIEAVFVSTAWKYRRLVCFWWKHTQHTQPSMQPDLESGTILWRTSVSESHWRRFLFGQQNKVDLIYSLATRLWVKAMRKDDGFGHNVGRNGEFCVSVSRASILAQVG